MPLHIFLYVEGAIKYLKYLILSEIIIILYVVFGMRDHIC